VLPDRECHERDDADADGKDRLDAGPAELVAVDQAPHHGQQAAAREAQAGQIESSRWAAGLFEPERRQGDGDQADRYVDPEDPLPIQALGDRPTDERTDRDGEAGDATPCAERDGSTFRTDGGGQDRQAEWRDDGATDALDRPSEDELTRGGREGCCGRPGGEDRQPDDEQAFAPEPIAERRAGQQQDGEGEGVGIHHPLELRDRGAEIGADDGQGGGDDEVVEGGHEDRECGDQERPGGTVHPRLLVS
jgi:hypothetical protein